jgi:hypothetical protein
MKTAADLLKPKLHPTGFTIAMPTQSQTAALEPSRRPDGSTCSQTAAAMRVAAGKMQV